MGLPPFFSLPPAGEEGERTLRRSRRRTKLADERYGKCGLRRHRPGR